VNKGHPTNILVKIDELLDEARLKPSLSYPQKFELRMHKDIYDKLNHAISWMAKDSINLRKVGTEISNKRQIITYCGMNVVVDNSFPLKLAVVEVGDSS